jgi:putative salt-induced outer membrane protein YdiY
MNLRFRLPAAKSIQHLERKMTHYIFDVQTRRRFGVALSFLVILLSLPAQAKRKDVVIMKNGDHFTGEVKKLQYGVLYVDLDYVSGSVGLDWLQVEQVQSTGGFQVVLKDGDRAVGAIEKVAPAAGQDMDFIIRGAHGEVRAAAPDVVDIGSQKRNFWRQLTGAIDVGYDFTSGNDQTSLSADANANYRSTKWLAGGSVTSSFSGQSGGSTSNLLDFQTLDGRFLSRNSFLMGLGDLLHSSQQDLALRTTLGGGYGRYLIRTNHNILVWLGGAVYTHENFQGGGQPAEGNVEALLGLEYEMFRFDRYNLQSQLLVYPGLTDPGRIRTTTKTTFTIKLVNNFHTDFSFWDNFDSSPPFNAKKNQLGISNGLGWTF